MFSLHELNLKFIMQQHLYTKYKFDSVSENKAKHFLITFCLGLLKECLFGETNKSFRIDGEHSSLAVDHLILGLEGVDPLVMWARLKPKFIFSLLN